MGGKTNKTMKSRDLTKLLVALHAAQAIKSLVSVALVPFSDYSRVQKLPKSAASLLEIILLGADASARTFAGVLAAEIKRMSTPT